MATDLTTGDAGSAAQTDVAAAAGTDAAAEEPEEPKESNSDAADSEDSRLQEQASKILNKFDVSPPPRIVVCGHSGAGRAVLINCMLRLPSTVSPKIVAQSSSGEDLRYYHAGVIFHTFDVSKEGLHEQDIEKHELGTADVCIYVHRGELPDDSYLFADILLTHGTSMLFVREGEDWQLSTDDLFFELELPDNSDLRWTPAFQSELHRLKASIGSHIQDRHRREEVNAMFAGDSAKLAELRATHCWDYYNTLLLSTTGTGAVPAPGLPTLAIMILVAAMLFLKLFCLLPSCVDSKEHAVLLKQFARKITPRIVAFAAAFVTADLSKDGLLIVPIAGLILSALLGGAVSAAAMHVLCKDLIPRLQSMAAAFYELDLNRIVDQEALDEFNELADKVFPLGPTQWNEADDDPEQEPARGALPLPWGASQDASSESVLGGSEGSVGECEAATDEGAPNPSGHQGALPLPWGANENAGSPEPRSTFTWSDDAPESELWGEALPPAAGGEATHREPARSSFASVLNYMGFQSTAGAADSSESHVSPGSLEPSDDNVSGSHVLESAFVPATLPAVDAGEEVNHEEAARRTSLASFRKYFGMESTDIAEPVEHDSTCERSSSNASSGHVQESSMSDEALPAQVAGDAAAPEDDGRASRGSFWKYFAWDSAAADLHECDGNANTPEHVDANNDSSIHAGENSGSNGERLPDIVAGGDTKETDYRRSSLASIRDFLSRGDGVADTDEQNGKRPDDL